MQPPGAVALDKKTASARLLYLGFRLRGLGKDPLPPVFIQ